MTARVTWKSEYFLDDGTEGGPCRVYDDPKSPETFDYLGWMPLATAEDIAKNLDVQLETF